MSYLQQSLIQLRADGHKVSIHRNQFIIILVVLLTALPLLGWVALTGTKGALILIRPTSQMSQPVVPSTTKINVIPTTGAGSVASAANASDSVNAKNADAFVDSVGINVHLHYTDTPYANFGAVKSALVDLGIRHIRDGLIDTTWKPYYDRLNELGKLGIKSTLLTTPSQSETVLATYPARVPESFEGYEAPNEYDLSGDPNWAATINSFMPKLYRAVKTNPSTSRFPVLGPSLTQAGSFPQMAATAPFLDFANLHNYFGGRNPGTPGWGSNGYGSMDWNLALVKDPWPGKPIITTESGYRNDLSNPQAIPEDISAKYLPRLLLEQWIHGIQRTYIYELVDLGGKFPDNSFGLVHSDFSPKAGYRAIKGLLQLLSDPGPPFGSGILNFNLSGDLANVHHLLLEKRNGTFYLALWVEQPSYDVNAKKLLPVAAHKIIVQTGGQAAMRVYHLDVDGNMETSPLESLPMPTLNVDDRVSILEISAPALLPPSNLRVIEIK